MAKPKLPKPKNDDQITFRIPSDAKADLVREADKLDRGHNWLARKIVLDWLSKRARKRKRPA